jgi:mannose-6-phosphate isomerase-like protein (cupin superfamily)
VEPGTVVRSPRGTVVEVLEDSPARFLLRRTLPPQTGKTAPHRHEDVGAERFRVLEGTATAKLDGRTVRLAAGDTLEVPLGKSHVHPHTGAGQTALIEHEVADPPGFVALYFPNWLRWLERGEVDRQDEPTLLQIMAILRASPGGTWVQGPPVAVQRALAAVLGRVKRLEAA